MTLKTLKDFDDSHRSICDKHCCLYADDLREEVIKWIKRALKLENKYLDENDFIKAAFHGGAHRILKELHNITEEDLK